MSILTELPWSWYRDDAFQGFSDALSFAPETARALMWLSQLAYEDAASDKARCIARKWGVEALPMERPAAPDIKASWLARLFDLNPQIFLKGQLILVVFPGTDPLRLAQLILDLNAFMNNDVHAGFQLAVQAIWPPVARAIERELTRDPTRRLVFVGHSLGAALAVLAADRAQKKGRNVRAVYAFGMPRAGNAEFAQGYNARLGSRTFRFVLGNDIVSTVPGSQLGYRHVGIFFPSEAGRFGAGIFADPPAGSEPVGWSNKPDFRLQDHRECVAALLQLDLLRKLADPLNLVLETLLGSHDERVAGILNFLLETPIRDHLPISYCRAF